MSNGKINEKTAGAGRDSGKEETKKTNGKLGLLLLAVVVLVVVGIVLFAVSVARSMHDGVADQTEEKKLALEASAIKPDISVVKLPGKVALELVKVEAGTFVMSSKDKSNWSDEKPHKAKLENDFYLGRTEVTQAQWKAVMGNEPSKFKGDDLPVEQVSWNDAMDFCAKLNALKLAPEGWMFTLPTETQWEYAARGGKKTRHCKFCGSDELEEVGWYGDSGKSKDNAAATENKGTTHPVAQKKANELGLYDMSGNVWEWCLDDYVGDSSKAKPEGRLEIKGVVSRKEKGKIVQTEAACQQRVVRGGSWSKGERYCRNAQRYYYKNDFRFANIGFRVALVKMSPTDVAQMAIAALKRHDFDTVVALAHGKAKDELKKHAAKFAGLKKAAEAGNETEKAKLAQVLSVFDKISIELKGGNVDAEFAIFEVERKFDGKTATDRMYVKKIGDLWKLVDESECVPAK